MKRNCTYQARTGNNRRIIHDTLRDTCALYHSLSSGVFYNTIADPAYLSWLERYMFYTYNLKSLAISLLRCRKPALHLWEGIPYPTNANGYLGQQMHHLWI